jgi:glycosyltransferase involved in cell wall biosynthesis
MNQATNAMEPAAGPAPAALFYDDSAYVELQQVRTAVRGDEAVGLMGAQVAGHEFLDACFTHGQWSELTAVVYNPASAASLRRFAEQHPSARKRKVHVVHMDNFIERFCSSPPAPVLHTPCISDPAYAWTRHTCAPHAFALSGVTHTLCGASAAQRINELVTAPFEPYDAVVCTSRAAVQMIRTVTQTYTEHLRQRHGGMPQLQPRLELIPLGVNPERFRPATDTERAQHRAAFNIAPEAIAVLFVGRFTPHAKAHPYPMLQGLARAAQATGQRVHLILAGWSPNDALQRALLEALQAFVPGMPVSIVNGMDPVYRRGVWLAADIFTSLVDNIQETFGLVMLEAMASGLPVVATDWDGYRDLIVHDETGIMVPTLMPHGATADTTLRLLLGAVDYDSFLAECNQAVTVDVDSAAKAYIRLLKDAELRRRMGAAGRQRVLENFTWERVIRNYEQLWRSQDEERRAVLAKSKAHQEPLAGPACYPPPEVTFASWPTRLLNDDTAVQAVAGGDVGRFLRLSLCNYVAPRRVTDQAELEALLNAAGEPRTLAELVAILTANEHSASNARATLAWLLKYNLLRVVT